jgi:hypothetical protein
MAELILPQQLKSLFQLQFRLLQRAWSQPSALQKWGVVVGLLVTGGLASVLGWVIGSLVTILGIYAREGPFQAQVVGYIFLVLLGLFGLIWLFSPLLFALQNDNLHLDLNKLLIYPLSFQSLYALHTLTGLIEPWSLFFYPLLIGLICGGVIVVGTGALAPLMILALLFGLLHIVWSRLLVNSLNSFLAHRRLRESAMLLLLLGIVVLAFLPALLGQQLENNPDWQSWIKSPAVWTQLTLPLNLLLAFSPAGMASLALNGVLQGQYSQVYQAEVGLFLWLVLGNYLGTALLRHMYTASPGLAEQANAAPRWWKSDLLFFLPYDLGLIVKKELRSLSRSVIGKLCFFLTPFLLVILRVFAFGPVAHAIPPTAVLLSAITYIFMTSLFLFCNLFGLDGQGFKLYLYGSLPAARLLLGKQLAMALFCSAEFLLVLYLYLVIFNPLHWETLLFVVLAFATVLVGVLGLGTLISIRFPTPLDLNQTRYRQSATPVLLAFQMLSLLLALPALAQVLAHFGQQPRSLVMAFFLGCVCLSHKLLFQFCTELFQDQKLSILDKITQPAQGQ